MQVQPPDILAQDPLTSLTWEMGYAMGLRKKLNLRHFVGINDG